MILLKKPDSISLSLSIRDETSPFRRFSEKNSQKIRLPAPFAPSESQKTRREPRKKREKRRGRGPPSEPHPPSPFAEPRRRLTRLAPPPSAACSLPQKRGLPCIARRDIRYTRSREGSGERQAASLNAEGGNRFPTLP